MEKKSFWLRGAVKNAYPKLNENIEADVAVCGAGITGVLCAYRLMKAGLSVILIDSGAAGGGVSAGSTGKVTSQHGLIYRGLIQDSGRETAEKHYAINQAAITEYGKIIAALKIDCGFEACGAQIFTQLSENADKLQAEADAVKSIGGYAEVSDKSELPFAVKAALRFPGQALIDPVKFTRGVAKKINSKIRIFESTKAIKCSENKLITEDSYEIKAKNIIIAAHYPFINKFGMYYAKLQQDVSMLIAGRSSTVLDDVHIAYEDSGNTIRNAGGGYLIFGGEGHRTGISAKYNRYERLKDEAIKAFPDFKPEYCWSAQDCMPPDRLPYIGRYSLLTPDLYVATGFAKWGLTQSMAASMILTDMITGVKNDYESIYRSTRLSLPQSLPKRFSYLKDSAAGLIKGNIINDEPPYEEPEKGRGGVYNHEGSRVGVYKDKEGRLHSVVAVCTHLSCKLSWNADDNTYDCPCHGSKFDIDGENIYNPALKPLKKYEIDK